MFQTKTKVPLFPTMLWTFQIPTDTFNRINTELRNKLDELIAAAPDDNSRGGFLQTAHDLHTLPEMQELNGYFMNAVNEVIGILSTKHKDVEITGCWANIHPADKSHQAHSHPNNYLSAVYYVTVPPGGREITFYDPRIQQYHLTPAFEQSNAYNAEHLTVEVEEGMLLLFPAWLVHSVPASTSKERRISISFNINFTDFNARISAPRWEPNVPTHPRPT
ncbi:MAG: 2OG-Fe(II) oxygenase family protein [Proteobacteria bacterium]|nr:2OG-Fe(II) oxygenase family protein [Pseudomonadota bacterium]